MPRKKLPPNYLQLEQHTAEWFEVRLGHCTASRVADAIWTLKNGKSSAAREKYKMDLLTEFITGRPVEHYVSREMDFGIEYEGAARGVYEMTKGVEIERIGFILHPTIQRAGASPDGLIGPKGLIEIKVPATSTHLGYLIGETVPEDYRPQMLWQMACSGRQWCDFVSYDPRLPEDFGLFVARLERDGEAIKAMERDVETFLGELNEMAGKLLKGRKFRQPLADVPGPGPERAVIPTEM